ncbi:MAG TPA: enoyl-CoA hydratase-related protein [Kofleriaceae bacterium]|jgi:enoyl-CoA hydratase/carnithine racemase|nr:enoyl-CoA hydratase-related protein [Kofleriaceae bacterium]
MESTILVQRDGAIVTVVLNRPDKLNALTRQMWARLGQVFEQLHTEDDLRCIVIRGAGTQAFAPGNDISEFETVRGNVEQARAYGNDMRKTIEAIDACRHPIVAQIHGVCVGGGLEIAGLADIRICGASSRFGVPIGKLGLVMAHAEIAALIRLVGEATALEILLEGRVFDAGEAKDKGLVTRVVADDQVEAEAMATARRIAGGAPLVARWHKKFARRLRDATPLTAAEYDEGFACFGTEDFRTGYRAFLAKQPPEFHAR